MADPRGILAPWGPFRKFALFVTIPFLLFLWVIAIPTGFCVTISLWVLSLIWRSVGAEPSVNKNTPEMYYHRGLGIRIATWFDALRIGVKKERILAPTRVLGIGSPFDDPDHGYQEGFFPVGRISSIWAIGGALLFAVPDYFTAHFHLYVWHGLVNVNIPGALQFSLSAIGWFLLLQTFANVRRIQGGDSMKPQEAEVRPAVMLGWYLRKDRAALRTAIIVSALLTLLPLTPPMLLWMVIRWPGWIQAIVLASVFLLFFFSWLNRFLMKDYTKEWQDRKERRQFWEDAQEKSGIRDPLFFISEEELPKEEEYLEIYSDGSGGVRDDAPDFFQVKVAQLAYPEGKGYPDYEALPKLLAASLGGSESSVGISPIGELDDEEQEIPNTVGKRGIRVWWADRQLPEILEPNIGDWVRELLVRSVVIPRISENTRIGQTLLVRTEAITKPSSRKVIVRIVLKPLDPGVSVSQFLDSIEVLQTALGVPWVRALPVFDKQTERRTGEIEVYIGDKPTFEDLNVEKQADDFRRDPDFDFVNPIRLVRRKIDKMNYYHFLTLSKFDQGGGPPELIESAPATDRVSKLKLKMPDGYDTDVFFDDKMLGVLGRTSGNGFISAEVGDALPKDNKRKERTRASRRSSVKKREEKDDLSTYITLTVSRKNPLDKVFQFSDYKDELLTGRVPGEPNINWAVGVKSDDTVARYDWESELPHLLVAGASNSGKSVVINSMICQIAYNNGPDEAQFWMAEPKNEMQMYQGIDMVTRFVDNWYPDPDDLIGAVGMMASDARAEMERRNYEFVRHPKRPKKLAKARAIAKTESKRNGTKLEDHPLYLPYIFLVFEECATLFANPSGKEEAAKQDELVTHVTELARKARSAGIYIVAATQYPTNSAIPMPIRAQMRRIGLKCQNSMSSNVVIDEPGLEKIAVKGAGKITDKNGIYQDFRGFLLEDGDVDEGQQNDMEDIIKQLPTNGINFSMGTPKFLQVGGGQQSGGGSGGSKATPPQQAPGSGSIASGGKKKLSDAPGYDTATGRFVAPKPGESPFDLWIKRNGADFDREVEKQKNVGNSKEELRKYREMLASGAV